MKFSPLIGSKWYHAHNPWLFFSSMAAAAEDAALLPSTQQSASGRWFLHWKMFWMRYRTAFETRSCLTYISHGCSAVFCALKPYGCHCWGGACCSSACSPSDSQVFLPRNVFKLEVGIHLKACMFDIFACVLFDNALYSAGTACEGGVTKAAEPASSPLQPRNRCLPSALFF